MKLLRRLTVVEWLTILGVMFVLSGSLLPDSATTTRWSLEKRARGFTSATVDRLSDESIIAMDVDITKDTERTKMENDDLSNRLIG